MPARSGPRLTMTATGVVDRQVTGRNWTAVRNSLGDTQRGGK